MTTPANPPTPAEIIDAYVAKRKITVGAAQTTDREQKLVELNEELAKLRATDEALAAEAEELEKKLDENDEVRGTLHDEIDRVESEIDKLENPSTAKVEKTKDKSGRRFSIGNLARGLNG